MLELAAKNCWFLTAENCWFYYTVYNSVIAYRYTVASPTSFEKYAIKVVNTRPLIVPELLKSKKSMGEQIFVKFHNATLKLYRSADGNFADSLKADSIELVDSE